MDEGGAGRIEARQSQGGAVTDATSRAHQLLPKKALTHKKSSSIKFKGKQDAPSLSHL